MVAVVPAAAPAGVSRTRPGPNQATGPRPTTGNRQPDATTKEM
ncbi:hypothetical protein SUDANB108_02276 [Streptomyces sp. enrichment culture]